MTTEEIRHVTMEGGEGLLAIVIRSGWQNAQDSRPEVSPPIQFLTPPDSPLQVGVMQRPSGYVAPRHTHLPTKRELYGTSEILLVQWGRIQVEIYTSGREWVASVVLEDGDMIVLLKGGHEVKFCHISKVLEVKQGPYLYDQDKGRW